MQRNRVGLVGVVGWDRMVGRLLSPRPQCGMASGQCRKSLDPQHLSFAFLPSAHAAGPQAPGSSAALATAVTDLASPPLATVAECPCEPGTPRPATVRHVKVVSGCYGRTEVTLPAWTALILASHTLLAQRASLTTNSQPCHAAVLSPHNASRQTSNASEGCGGGADVPCSIYAMHTVTPLL